MRKLQFGTEIISCTPTKAITVIVVVADVAVVFFRGGEFLVAIKIRCGWNFFYLLAYSADDVHNKSLNAFAIIS